MRIIKKFLIIKKKNIKKLFIWEHDKIQKKVADLKTDQSFIFGYDYNYNEGEFIKIFIINKLIILKNDYLGSCPCYIYKKNKEYVISNSIDEIAKIKKLEIDKSKLFEYFKYSFISSSDYTIYKNLEVLKPESKIYIKKDLKYYKYFKNIFFNSTKKSTPTKLKLNKILDRAIIKKLSKLKKRETTLLTTSGFDSLLSIIKLKNLKKEFDTSTFGTKKSNDIYFSKIRSKSFFKTKHYNLELSKLQIKINDLKFFCRMVGGISNLSAINVMFFTKYLIRKQKYLHIYSDHFEATRRVFLNTKNCLKSYATRKEILEENIIIKNYKDNVLKNINFKHKKNPYSFYLYERYLKGASHSRTNIVNSLGAIKVNLPIDKDFLIFNNKFILKNKRKSFNSLIPKNKKNIKNLKHSLKIKQKNLVKDMPYDTNFLVNKFSNFFCSEIKKSKKNNFQKFFNLDIMKKKIFEKKYYENEEWFLLRAMSIIIFSNHHDIKIK